MKTNNKIAMSILTLAVLSACGGGGGGDGGSPGPAPAPPSNAAPVASAAAPPTVSAGTVVTVDGSGSTDANNDALTYSWALTTKPPGSVATLLPATSAKPVFTADISGTYVATLLVSDGKASSTATTVTINATVPNGMPVANAGTAQRVMVLTGITLDGSASTDAEGDPLTYKWVLTSKPVDSTAELSSASAIKPTFVTDKAGDYVATLVVNDGHADSAAGTVTVKADAFGHIGVPYQARNGVFVTLDSFTRVDRGDGSYSYTAVYTQVNLTSESRLDEAGMKMYFTNDAPNPQQVALGWVYFGEANKITTTYAFVQPKASIPYLLEYDLENYNFNGPVAGSLRWAIPVLPK